MILNRRIPITYIFKQIKWDLLFVAIFAASSHYIDEHIFDIVLPSEISAFLGTAISLLLSFKLSQSYDRWWEARKIWGAIVNDSRSFTVQLKNYTDYDNSEETKSLVKTMVYRQIAWCHSFSLSLRNIPIRNQINHLLNKRDILEIKKHKNIPLAITNLNGQSIRELKRKGSINDFQEVELNNTLVRIIDSMGRAERIKNTVFPRTYRVFLHLSIYIFLAALAASLTDLHSYYEVPVLLGMSLPFFLLEKTALQIQDPFENRPTDISTDAISQTIEMNLRQLLDEEDVAEPKKTDKFYLM